MAQKSGVESQQIEQRDGVNRPIIVTTYDNLNEVTETQQYLGDGVTPTINNGALSPLAANSLRAQEIDSYDDQGRVYETQVYDVSSLNNYVPSGALTTNYYRDLRGDVIAESDPGGLWTKSVYDGAGRDVMDYTTDGAGGTGSWLAISSVTNDTVLEQTQTKYDNDGNVTETIDSQRFDSVAGFGALAPSPSGVPARVYYTASYYDNADRKTADVNVGDNQGAAWMRPNTPPTVRSATALLTTYVYTYLSSPSSGLVVDATDPMGFDTRTLYDNLGRTIKTIQHYTGAAETTSSDIATEYGYDGNNNVTYVQADQPGGSYQKTAYLYGVTTADGSGVNSNDLLAATQYPDPTTGNPSTVQQVALTGTPTGGTFTLTFRGQTTAALAYNAVAAAIQSALAALSTIGSGNVQVSGSAGGPWQIQFIGALAGTFTPTLTGNGSGLTGGTSPAVAITTQQVTSTYNALGEVVQSTDRGGNVHQYSYDVLGRETADAVTALGAGVDGTVRRIQYAYDSQGNQYLITTYNAASGGTIVNQVEDVYNGLDQLTGEYQSHSGAVVPGTTPEVQYAYTELTAGNNSRLTSITYPDKYVLYYNYNSGLDSNISRLSSISDSVSQQQSYKYLESYLYLGLDTVVERDHPQISVNQTYISQNGKTGDGGDKYVGLDRFGRVVDQNWYNTNTGKSTDDFQYGYDQDSDVLYKQNMVDNLMSELYQYDSLNQLLSYARGQLNSTDNGIVSGTQSDSQGWTANALGDFTSVTTNSTPQTRTSNQQNEVSSISGYGTIAYDANGNLTQDGYSNTLTYDAWNHLVSIDGGLDTYSYDGLGRVLDGTLGTDLYYSSSGQVLEEDVAGVKQAQNVWSPVYANAMVLRDQASVFESGNLDTRVYVEQDANWNVTALWDVSKGAVAQRYAYQPYGAVAYLNPDFSPASGDSYGVPYLWQGMMFDSSMNLYFSGDGLRVYSLLLMDWLQTDPSGQSTGDNGYKAMGNAPTDTVDPTGLLGWKFYLWEGPKAAVTGMYEGGRNMATGAKDTVVEMGQAARDMGNTVVSGASLLTNKVGLTGVYVYDLQSNTFGGYDRALKQSKEAGGRFMLKAMADGASLGTIPIADGVVDYIQTGDATNASRTMGGVATGNLAGAAGMKVMSKIPLPFRRGKSSVHLDIGGEGRYPDAINVNSGGRLLPKGEIPRTTTTGAPGRPIPNLVKATGEQLPFANQVADLITLENAPITQATASEIARVIKPGGEIRLLGPADVAAVEHQRVIQVLPRGTTFTQTTIGTGDATMTRTVIKVP